MRSYILWLWIFGERARVHYGIPERKEAFDKAKTSLKMPQLIMNASNPYSKAFRYSVSVFLSVKDFVCVCVYGRNTYVYFSIWQIIHNDISGFCKMTKEASCTKGICKRKFEKPLLSYNTLILVGFLAGFVCAYYNSNI